MKPFVRHHVTPVFHRAKRHATYLTSPYWADPSNIRYYSLDGMLIDKSDAIIYRGDVIGESLQYDLRLFIPNEQDFRKILQIFHKHANKFCLNYLGRPVLTVEGDPIANPQAITNSWETPLFTCTFSQQRKPKSIPSILAAFEFTIPVDFAINSLHLKTIVRGKRKPLDLSLRNIGVHYTTKKIYVPRKFVEGYIDADA